MKTKTWKLKKKIIERNGLFHLSQFFIEASRMDGSNCCQSLWRRDNARKVRWQFTLSTHLIIRNYPVILSHRRSTTVSWDFLYSSRLPLFVREGMFFTGGGGGGEGVGRGILEIFLREKSWPSHIPEWINAWPFTSNYTKTSDPPPTSSKTK